MAKNVLIVDDDQGSQKYVSTVLRENGYEPHSAYDGKEGLEKLQEIKPDLIVLDVMMPKKTGFTLFKQIKRDDELKERIFSPFFSTKFNKGTGLGLTITMKIVREHNGTLLLDTLPGQGSTFTIKLPVIRQEEDNKN